MEITKTGGKPTGNTGVSWNSVEARGGHAVCAVGYDDFKQCFIVRNSWGEDWGDKGHLAMVERWKVSKWGELDGDSFFFFPVSGGFALKKHLPGCLGYWMAGRRESRFGLLCFRLGE